jgi:hypothetical protein
MVYIHRLLYLPKPRPLGIAGIRKWSIPVVSPSCSLITFNNRKLFSSTLPSQHPTPPRPGLCGLLSAWGIGVGLAPTLLLLGRIVGFWRLSRRLYCGRDPLQGSHEQPACFGVGLALGFELVA